MIILNFQFWISSKGLAKSKLENLAKLGNFAKFSSSLKKFCNIFYQTIILILLQYIIQFWLFLPQFNLRIWNKAILVLDKHCDVKRLYHIKITGISSKTTLNLNLSNDLKEIFLNIAKSCSQLARTLIQIGESTLSNYSLIIVTPFTYLDWAMNV